MKGIDNKVADTLSRYYKNNTWDDCHDVSEYVNVDRRLDPGLEDIPPDQRKEVTSNTVQLMAMEAGPRHRSACLER